MSMPEDYLKDPEDFLPIAPPVPGIQHNFPPPDRIARLPLTGPAKYAGQFVRGASLGFLGDPDEPQNLPQILTEGLGMVAPTVALSAGLGPVVGATPMLRTFPIAAKRMITSGIAGA